MEKIPIRTRFAPSPTGYLHIGGARTALYAYLAANSTGGDFLLRIEDTDRTRLVDDAMEKQMEALRWLGIQWDEGPEVGGDKGPYIQSERLDLYKKYALELVEKGKAYYCFRTAEELLAIREQQQAQGLPPRYKGHENDWSPEEVQEKLEVGESYVIRMITPESGAITFTDIVKGEITIDAKEIDDQVLLKSDGFPTYHLAVIVDDYLMGINTVMRSDEWLPSTPKHILLYQYFGWDLPQFAHLPVYLSKNGGKMSKRDGETSLLAFRDNGYLPEAVVNFSVLLGWNPKTTEEFFTKDELVSRFTLENVQKSGAVFETEKLDWMNQHYIRETGTEELLGHMQVAMDGMTMNDPEKVEEGKVKQEQYKRFIDWFTALDTELQNSIMDSLKERTKTLLEMTEVVHYTEHNTAFEAEDIIWRKSDKETTIIILNTLIEKLQEIDGAWVSAELESVIIPWIADGTEWGNGDVLWPMRYALCGEQRSPSPFELSEIIGKEQTIKRLSYAKDLLSK